MTGQEEPVRRELSEAEELLDRVVGRKWQLVRFLGEGGMARVFEARRTGSDITQALKILKPKDDPILEKRFMQEIALASKIKHPFVIRIHDYDVDTDGTLYYLMDLIEGQNLKDLLQDGPLDEARALRIARDIAIGMEAAHKLGIVHRDLKPENVMLSAEDRITLLDFGIAKIRRSAEEKSEYSPLTRRMEIWATADYMSPEQALSDPHIGQGTDIYSLGIMLYEMVCGRRPFSGSREDLVNEHVHKKPPAPRKVKKGLRPDIESLILRMLAKTVPARPPDMKTVQREIEDILQRIETVQDIKDLSPQVRQPQLPSGRGALDPGPPRTIRHGDPGGMFSRLLGKKAPMRLFINLGQNGGQIHEIYSDSVTVGRDPTNQIIVKDPQVSRKHARISRDGASLILHDLGSSNGTLVEGERLQGPRLLCQGDRVEMGNVAAFVGGEKEEFSRYWSLCPSHHPNPKGARFCGTCGGGIRQAQGGKR